MSIIQPTNGYDGIPPFSLKVAAVWVFFLIFFAFFVQYRRK